MKKKKNKVRYLTCWHCGKRKPDVCERPDNYALDVLNQEDATHVACDECDHQRTMDI